VEPDKILDVRFNSFSGDFAHYPLYLGTGWSPQTPGLPPAGLASGNSGRNQRNDNDQHQESFFHL